MFDIIHVKYHSDIKKLEKIKNGDWIDLRASERYELKQGDFKLIDLGVSIKLPKDCEAHVVPRSSTYKTWGVIQANSLGVIDESYCGEEDVWKYPVIAMRDTVIEKNDRICQFRIFKKMEHVTFKTVKEMEDASRGGFGQTGRD